MAMLRDFRPTLRRTSRISTLNSATSRTESIVDCGRYIDGIRWPTAATVDSTIEELRAGNSGFVWLGLHEPSESELVHLAQQFGLHPLAVEDTVDVDERPKLEQYNDVLFAVFKTVRYVSDRNATTAHHTVVETGKVMVFVGQNFVLTVRRGDTGGLQFLRKRLENDPERLMLGPSAVLHAIADHIVDEYVAATRALQDDVERIESAVFSTRNSKDAERIYELKRAVLGIKRAVMPLAGPLGILAQQPMPSVSAEIAEYFRDVNDHLTRVTEQVASLDEMLTTLVQANLAQVTVAQNEDMRRISAWVAIISVPTAAAGVYGMNFDHMPELHWRYGYPMVLAAVATVCLLLYRGFRRNGWL